MSSFTHCSHVFLLLPRPLAPSTTSLLQADTQSSTLLRSRCPNHLNLPRLTTSATQLIPRRLHKSSLHCTFCPFYSAFLFYNLWFNNLFLVADNRVRAPRKAHVKDFSIFNQRDAVNYPRLSPQLALATFQFLSTSNYAEFLLHNFSLELFTTISHEWQLSLIWLWLVSRTYFLPRDSANLPAHGVLASCIDLQGLIFWKLIIVRL